MTALEVVKADLQNHTAILLIKYDPAAKKLLVAWTIYAPRCSDFVIRGTENAKDLIARLWSESLPIDMPTLSAIAGIPQTRAQVIFDRLRAANLIWPDGTIPGNVESLLIGEAGYYVSTLVPKGGIYRGRPRNDPGRADVPVPDKKDVRAGPDAGPGANPGGRGAPVKNPRTGKQRSKKGST